MVDARKVRSIIASAHDEESRTHASDSLLRLARSRADQIPEEWRVLPGYVPSGGEIHPLLRTEYAAGYLVGSLTEVELLPLIPRLDDCAYDDFTNPRPLHKMLRRHEVDARAECAVCGRFTRLRLSVCRPCVRQGRVSDLPIGERCARAWKLIAVRKAPVLEVYPDGLLHFYRGSRWLSSAIYCGYTRARILVVTHPDAGPLSSLPPPTKPQRDALGLYTRL